MDLVNPEFGHANPDAPAALARFAFLIGRWRCAAHVRSSTGEWQTFQATWLGRFILDGYAIADEYRMTNASGELIVLGLNLRTYDAISQVWRMKWLHALTGTWVDLGPEELGRSHLRRSINHLRLQRADGRPSVYARHVFEHFKNALHMAR